MRRQSILQSRFTKFENSWKALNPSDHILRSLKRTSFQVAFAYPFVFLARQISPLSVCLSACLSSLFHRPRFADSLYRVYRNGGSIGWWRRVRKHPNAISWLIIHTCSRPLYALSHATSLVSKLFLQHFFPFPFKRYVFFSRRIIYLGLLIFPRFFHLPRSSRIN